MSPSNEPRPLGAAGLWTLSFPVWNDTPIINPSREILQAAIPPADARRVRLQYLAQRLHGLGERPLFHFLDEVERGEPLRQHLERYAQIDPDFVRALGGDKFAPALQVIEGGKS